MKTILLTGGTGFIGSHVCLEVINAGWRPIILDNLCNSMVRSIDGISRISANKPVFVQGDVRDPKCLSAVMERYNIDSVVHLAGLKSVSESVSDPIAYYDNNVSGSIVILRMMAKYGIRSIIFSSSATVYGRQESMPIRESATTKPTNPYGRSKLFVEQIVDDWVESAPDRSAIKLRYFNPVGAHPSGQIGESPLGQANNLMPIVSQVAAGLLPKVCIFGGDYDTKDGTGIRDYIHVVDLAKGHVAALKRVMEGSAKTSHVINLGTGAGYSVLEVVREYERQSRRTIPFDVVERRPGDVPMCYAEVSLAKQLLGWMATKGLPEMCADSWRWQQSRPVVPHQRSSDIS